MKPTTMYCLGLMVGYRRLCSFNFQLSTGTRLSRLHFTNLKHAKTTNMKLFDSRNKINATKKRLLFTSSHLIVVQKCSIFYCISFLSHFLIYSSQMVCVRKHFYLAFLIKPPVYTYMLCRKLAHLDSKKLSYV